MGGWIEREKNKYSVGNVWRNRDRGTEYSEDVNIEDIEIMDIKTEEGHNCEESPGITRKQNISRASVGTNKGNRVL